MNIGTLMDTNLATTWNREDRDLLVELRTEMRAVRDTLDRLNNGLNARIAAVEQSKLDRTEYNRLQSEDLKVKTDHEERIGILEDIQKVFKGQIKIWLWVGIGLFTVFQIGLQAFISFVIK